MNSLVNSKAIKDILFLYELSLSIGGNLDLDQSISDFVNVLMSKRSFSYFSLWLNKSAIRYSSEKSNKFQLYYSYPVSFDGVKEIDNNHIILNSLQDRPYYYISSDNSSFNDYLTEKNLNSGSVIIYNIDKIGFIKIIDTSKRRYSNVDISKLDGVIKKFGNHIMACLYHESALELADERKELLAKISERENVLSSVISNFPGLFWLKDRDGKYSYINSDDNAILQSIFRLPSDDIIGKSDKEIFERNILRDLHQEDKLVKLHKKIVSRTFQSNDPDSNIWYESVKFPILQRNKISGIAGYIKDITAKKNSELRLLLQSTAIESVSHAIFITDTNGRFIYVNKAFERITGFKNQELVNLTPAILKSGYHSQEFYAKLWYRLKKGITINEKFINKAKVGNLIHIEQTITPVRDNSDIITHFVSVFKDTTEQDQIKKELLLSEQRFEFALDSTGTGVWDWDPESDTVFFSKQWKYMLGYAEDEIANSLDEWSSRVHPDDLEKCYQDIEKHLKGETDVYINEHRMKHKHGHYVWILDRGQVIKRNADGKPSRIIGTHTDITSIKQVEQRLREGIEKEKELNDLKSTFVSVASHEFRTPLATMLTSAESLLLHKDKMTKGQIDERIQKILRQVDHMSQIVEDVLKYEKFRTKKDDLILENEDIVKFVSSIVNEINQALTYERVILKCNEQEIHLPLSKKMIYQIITNLINNGLKFSDDPVEVKIEKQPGMLYFSISDNGIGIDQSEVKNIFNAFYRARNTNAISGTGLGLSVVKEAVENLKGDIAVESTLGKGTQVRIMIPTTNNNENKESFSN